MSARELSPPVNEWVIKVSGTEYPCIHLDASVKVAPCDRESFIEINPGHMPSLARCWMTGDQWSALPAGVLTGSTPVAFVLRGNAVVNFNTCEADQNEVETAAVFYLVASPEARTEVEGDGTIYSGSAKTVYECLWATIQRRWMWMCIEADYNVLNMDKTYLVPNTADDEETQTVMQDIVDDLEAAYNAKTGLTINLGTVPDNTLQPPYNFTIREMPFGTALSRLFQPHSWQIQYNIFTGAWAIKALSNTDTTDTDLMDTYGACCGYEGATASDGGTILRHPNKVNCLFPKWPKPEDGVRFTTITTVDGAGLPNTVENLFIGDHFDLHTDLSKNYDEDTLANIAADRAARFYARAKIEVRTAIFSGHYDTFMPNTQIRRVRISMDLNGSFTTVYCHGLYDVGRQDHHSKFEIRGLVKAPHFPERGEVDDKPSLFPRDDGVLDVEHAPGFWAWIDERSDTEAGSAWHDIREIEFDNATSVWQVKTGGIDHVALELNDWENVPMETRVWVWIARDDAAAPLYVFDIAGGDKTDTIVDVPIDEPGWNVELQPDYDLSNGMRGVQFQLVGTPTGGMNSLTFPVWELGFDSRGNLNWITAQSDAVVTFYCSCEEFIT